MDNYDHFRHIDPAIAARANKVQSEVMADLMIAHLLRSKNDWMHIQPLLSILGEFRCYNTVQDTVTKWADQPVLVLRSLVDDIVAFYTDKGRPQDVKNLAAVDWDSIPADYKIMRLMWDNPTTDWMLSLYSVVEYHPMWLANRAFNDAANDLNLNATKAYSEDTLDFCISRCVIN